MLNKKFNLTRSRLTMEDIQKFTQTNVIQFKQAL